MPTKNPWLNPYQRSFNAIKEQLRKSLQINVPEITDYSEGNIFMIILSIYAAIAEVLHYYIDNVARETFFVTARKYTSLYKHAKLVDYHIKSAVPASVDLTMYTTDGKDLTTNIYIPTGTVFNSTDGKSWIVTAKDGITWDKTLYPRSIKVPVVQKEPYGPVVLSNGVVSPDFRIAIKNIPTGKRYVEGSLVLKVGDVLWEEVQTFAYSGPNSKVFKVEMDSDMIPYITFGDGTFGMKPSASEIMEGTYFITTGSEGNLAPGSFTTVPSIPGVDTSNISVTNHKAASGGSDYENFSMLKEHVPLSVKTLGVAITKEDFENFAKLVPGVNKAYAEYICGKEVYIYITPDNGEIEASKALIEEVTAQLNKSKVITTSITVLPIHRALIYLDAEIYGKKSFTAVDIQKQIVEAMQDFYGFNQVDLGRSVKLSDVYGLIDNLSTVDNLLINKLYILPEPQLVSSEGSGSYSPDLSITSFSQESYVRPSEDYPEFVEVFITITNDTNYRLDIGGESWTGTFGEDLTVNQKQVVFTINIESQGYNSGDRYNFYLGPMNTNIATKANITNKAVPVFLNRSDTLKLNIHEQV